MWLSRRINTSKADKKMVEMGKKKHLTNKLLVFVELDWNVSLLVKQNYTQKEAGDGYHAVQQ